MGWLGMGVLVGAGDQHLSLLLGLGAEGVGSMLMGAAMMMATMILSCAVFIFRDCFEPPESLLHGAHHETTPPPPTAGPN
jgi:hypothetical protein